MDARIAILAKAPVPGLAKTRLAPLLGEDGAAALAAQMLEWTCAEAAAVAAARPLLWTTPDPGRPEWRGHLPAGIPARGQGDGDLGRRMARAAREGIASLGAAVLIGTDCPALDRNRIAAAVAGLGETDAVIFPAEDGGYVLLALRRFSDRLFDSIAWSTPDVFATTMARLEELDWSVTVGPVMRDVDGPDDYRVAFPDRAPARSSKPAGG